LGTDSLATVRVTEKQRPELNLFAEMRALMTHDKAVSPAEVLQMATVNGARALGRKGQIGELSAGAFADLIALPAAAGGKDGYDAVLEHAGPVQASMIDGRWVIPAR
jgi:cytosine/adenosine deaminase-related metal-dependent hydrolase